MKWESNMKKELMGVLLAALTVSVFASDPNPTASASAAPSHAAANTVCPVSGNRIVGFIGKPLYAQYQGKNIAVCCSECLTKFQNNPDKYGPLALKNDSANEPMKRPDQ
jgi:YHS domain-containing protein